jgi:hypothetical protein
MLEASNPWLAQPFPSTVSLASGVVALNDHLSPKRSRNAVAIVSALGF